jgi:hypothetical protein
MALPPNNNDLQRAKARELNKIASFDALIRSGSFANSSRDNVVPPLASVTPTPQATATPQVTTTPTVTPTITLTRTQNQTPTPTPTIQFLSVAAIDAIITTGSTNSAYNTYYSKVNNPDLFFDPTATLAFINMTQDVVIYFDGLNLDNWVVFDVNQSQPVASNASGNRNRLPISNWATIFDAPISAGFTAFTISSITPTPTPTITITPSQTPTNTPTISITPSITPTITLTPSITPTITYMPPALVVTTISGVSANFFNYLGLTGTYLRQGFNYPGMFFKNGTRQSAFCDISWYDTNDLYTGSPAGYLMLANYDDADPEILNSYYWGAAFANYPSNSAFPPEPLNRDLPPSGRYFPLSAPVDIFTGYLLLDPTLCLNVAYDYTPLTPTPTPSITPTISLTPTITPSITPTISITPSITPTISITPSITPTITLTPSVTPTTAPSTTIYVSGDAQFFANFTNIPGQSAFVMFTDGTLFNSKPFYSYVGLYDDNISMYWVTEYTRWVLAYNGSFFITNTTDSYYPPFKETYAAANGWSLWPANSAFFGATTATISSLRITNYLLFPTPTPTPTKTSGFTQQTIYQAYSVPLTFTNTGLSYNIQQVGSGNPTLTAYRGQNYDLITTYLSSTHPLALRISSGNTSPVSGTYNNYPSTGSINSGVIMFTPNGDTPDEIIYQCVVHSSMSGRIVIKNRLYSPYDIPTPLPSSTPTVTPTPSITPTISLTPSVTQTATRTPTITPTISPTIGSISDGVKSINVFYTNGVSVSTVPAGYWRNEGTVYTAVCANINNDYFYLIFAPNLSPLSGSDRWCFVQDNGVTEYPRAMFDSFDSTHIPSTTGWRFINYPGARGSQANFNTLRISLCSVTGTPY